MKALIQHSLLITLFITTLQADDWPMWGLTRGRNLAVPGTNVPTSWDVKTGKNIKWVAELGSQTYNNVSVAGGKLFIGTNNQAEKNPQVVGDRGVVMCFNEADGKFIWQAAHPKLPTGRVNDWPEQGICSIPLIDGDRLFYVSNEARIVCADVNGFLDDENDGPYTSEKATSKIDVDIVWELDMMDELAVFPHNLATCSIVDDGGDLLFVVTSNGVDEAHLVVPSPRAPDFICVDKKTGKVVWEDNPVSDRILHGEWSNPAYGIMGGKPQVVFAGGDGVVYSYEPKTGKQIWKFDCNLKDSKWILGGRGTRNNIIATPVIYKDHVYIGVGQDPEHGEGPGHLYCIDGTKTGDVTKSGKVWHFGDEKFNRTMSTCAITDDGLLFITDLSGFLYCLDAKTGKQHWRHDLLAAVWGSVLVVDGKVIIGDEDGDLEILEAKKTKKVLFETNMGNAVYSTPVFVNNTLYIANRNKLYAIGAK
ncbi:MAG: PQQ-binding-like beta-propeller repeat protein [Planctomycetota bacterium]|nr:PQQ-binding-like beta-propeller repeat protein [Planctomycetota bacterium]MDA1142953.1 PQQ-binding-like beta-propeller repeat protein [Planctomycetota bacterium]